MSTNDVLPHNSYEEQLKINWKWKKSEIHIYYLFTPDYTQASNFKLMLMNQSWKKNAHLHTIWLFQSNIDFLLFNICFDFFFFSFVFTLQTLGAALEYLHNHKEKAKQHKLNLFCNNSDKITIISHFIFIFHKRRLNLIWQQNSGRNGFKPPNNITLSFSLSQKRPSIYVLALIKSIQLFFTFPIIIFSSVFFSKRIFMNGFNL